MTIIPALLPIRTRRIRWLLWLSLSVLCLLLMPRLAHAQSIIYVDGDATGANSGASWANAYTDLQSVLGSAASGDEIWVAAGLYTPGTFITSTFVLTDDVALYGGFAGTPGTEGDFGARDWQANPTVLSGDLTDNDTTDASGVVTDTATIVGPNAYHVVTSSAVTTTAVLDGFFVTAGSATGSFVSPCGPRCGGGMYNALSSPTLTNVTFSGNTATFDGGGMFNSNSNPMLTNVSFSGNTAAVMSGGGMRNFNSSPTLTNVSFSGNAARFGGGMVNFTNSSPTLTNVSFISNTAPNGDGGGMYNSFNSSPTLTDVTFSGNSAFYGGGMFNANASSPTVMDVTFSDNSAYDGGGMNNDGSSAMLSSVTFISNTATNNGGGMVNANASSPALTDVTFSDNSAYDGGGTYNDGSSPTLTSVTFISNTATNNGGGMVNVNASSPTLTDVTFSDNSADDGGGMNNDGSSPTLTSVTFISNTATNNGGGMVNVNASSPMLTNVSFSGNEASGGGGLYNQESSPLLTDVTFSGNGASSAGGMYNINSSPTLTNVAFSGNMADNGGGMFNSNSSSPTLTNVTFSGNTASNVGGGMFNVFSGNPLIQNTILWGNTAGSDGSNILNSSSSPTVRFSLIEGGIGAGSIDGGNNLEGSLNPLFVGAANGDLRLLPASPAIDVGDNAADLDGEEAGTLTISDVISDLAGGPRIVAVGVVTPTVDLGAYEASNSAPIFVSSSPLTATQALTYTYAISSSDPNQPGGSGLTLSELVIPAWLNLVDNSDGSGTLSGAPANSDVGDHAVTLQVMDSVGLTTTQSFTVTVANVNDPPSFTSTPVTDATQDAPYNYSITTDDPDVGDNRTLTAIVKPGWLVLTDNTDGTGTLSGTPTNGDVGEHDITLQVEDAGGLNATQSFTVTVANVNDPPTFTSSPPLTATEGLAYTYAVSTTDPDAGDTRSLTLLVGPGWLALTDNGNGTATLSGTLSGTPGAGDVGDVGDDPVTLQVQDMDGLTDTQSFIVTVSAVVSDTGGLAGQVTSEGIGVPGVTVTVNSEAAANAVRAAAVVTETMTDDAGTYFVDSLTPGDYTLTFDPPDGYDPPDPVDVTVVVGQTANVPNVSLTGNSTLLHLPVVVTQGP